MTTVREVPDRSKLVSVPHRAWLAVWVTVVASAVSLLAPQPASAEDSFNLRMVDLVNQARAASGVAPLRAVGVIGGIAEAAPYSGCGFGTAGRAFDMGQRNYFSHTIASCGGREVFDMLGAAGVPYSVAAENIGWVSGSGSPTAAANALHNGFMNSPGHRSNLLEGRFNVVGVGSWLAPPGQAWSGGGTSYTQVAITAVVLARVPDGYGRVPAAPSWVTAGAGNGSVTVNWQAVPGPAGGPVDAYAVLVFDPSGYTGRHIVVCGSCTSGVVGGLANGAYYAVAVLAHNSTGWGDATFSGWALVGAPSAPAGVSGSATGGGAGVSWSAAAGNGAPVQAYAALAYDAGGFVGLYGTACGTCTSASVAGLTSGRSYYLLVLAYNVYGWGTPTASNWLVAA